MSKARVFIIFIAAEILALSVLYAFCLSVEGPAGTGRMEARRELVLRLELTDFAVWTEARYTRHPTQADFFSPFQDFPSSLEHFPAGSVMAPPYRREGGR